MTEIESYEPFLGGGGFDNDYSESTTWVDGGDDDSFSGALEDMVNHLVNGGLDLDDSGEHPADSDDDDMVISIEPNQPEEPPLDLEWDDDTKEFSESINNRFKKIGGDESDEPLIVDEGDDPLIVDEVDEPLIVDEESTKPKVGGNVPKVKQVQWNDVNGELQKYFKSTKI